MAENNSRELTDDELARFEVVRLFINPIIAGEKIPPFTTRVWLFSTIASWNRAANALEAFAANPFVASGHKEAKSVQTPG